METAQPSANEGKDCVKPAQKSEAISPDLSIYSSCDFYLWCFKVLPCSKRWSHEWTTCPFAHPGEKAKRRDPRTHQYDCEMCPAVVKGEQCELGAACPHSHHVFESWLHPQKFRTMLCKDGDSCNREVCFFAHGQEQLRVPTRDAALRGPSRPRIDHEQQCQQPWTSAAVSAAAAASAHSAGSNPASETARNSSSQNTRQVRFHFPLRQTAGQPGSGQQPAGPNGSTTGLQSAGSLPTSLAGFKAPAALQQQQPQLWRTVSDHKPSACETSMSNIAVMPVVSEKPLSLDWQSSSNQNLPSSTALQTQLAVLSGNVMSGSSSLPSGASAMSSDMCQLLNSMIQQNGNAASRNASLPDGAVLDGFLNRSASYGLSRHNSGIGRQDLNTALSGDVAAMLLQQQLAKSAAVSEAQQQIGNGWGPAGDSQQELQDKKMAILQQLQGQLILQEAASAASTASQSLNTNSMASGANLGAGHPMSEASTVPAGDSSFSLEQLQQVLAASSGFAAQQQAANSGACLIPSSSNLLPSSAAAGNTAANNADLLELLQLQQQWQAGNRSIDGLLLQQQAGMQAAAAAALEQLQANHSMQQSQDGLWGTGDLLSHPGFNSGSNLSARSAPGIGLQDPVAEAAAASLLLGLSGQNAGSGLGRMNSAGVQQQQLASDYLLQLQQNMQLQQNLTSGCGFYSAPDAALYAAANGRNAAMGNVSGGRMSLDAAAGYAALLGGQPMDQKMNGRASFDERRMHRSANGLLWQGEDVLSSSTQLFNNADPAFPPGHTATGGSKQLGWL